MADQFREDRLKKLERLIELGTQPYGQRTQGIQSTTEVHQQIEALDLGVGETSEASTVSEGIHIPDNAAFIEAR